MTFVERLLDTYIYYLLLLLCYYSTYYTIHIQRQRGVESEARESIQARGARYMPRVQRGRAGDGEKMRQREEQR